MTGSAKFTSTPERFGVVQEFSTMLHRVRDSRDIFRSEYIAGGNVLDCHDGRRTVKRPGGERDIGNQTGVGQSGSCWEDCCDGSIE